jgi:hypothetical protein
MMVGDHNQTSLAYRLKWFLGTSRLGFIVEVSDVFFSAVYCLNYIMQTYTSSITGLQAWLWAICAVVFSLHFILDLLVSNERLRFLASLHCLLDLGSIAPVVLLFLHLPWNLWTRLLRLLQVLRIFRLGRVAKFMKTEINQQLFRYPCAG